MESFRKEIPKNESAVEFVVLLDKTRYGERLPVGKPGEVRQGYSFYEPVGSGNETELSLITSRLGDSPELIAVDEKQYNAWKKKNIIAKPVDFVWDEVNGYWNIRAR